MATRANEEQLRGDQEWAELPEAGEGGELGPEALGDPLEDSESDYSTESEDENGGEATTLGEAEVRGPRETNPYGWQDPIQLRQHEGGIPPEVWRRFLQSFETVAVRRNAQLSAADLEADERDMFDQVRDEDMPPLEEVVHTETAGDEGRVPVRMRHEGIVDVFEFRMPARSISDELIASLPRKNFIDYTKGKEAEETDSECHICLLDYENNESVIELKCKHYFHEECIVRWLKQRKTCPKCRAVVKKESAVEGQLSGATWSVT